MLDNCEHLIDACADLAERVLAGCPRVRLLATSRERLRIGGETTWRVPSLAGPDPQASASAADLLGLPRRPVVRRARPGGPVRLRPRTGGCIEHGSNLRAIGGPAARARAGGRARVDSGVGADSGAPRRQCFGYWSVVAAARQRASRRSERRSTGATACSRKRSKPSFDAAPCSPGVGAWKAAEAVCPASTVSTEDVLELLTHLVDKSLVVVTADEPTGDHATACWSPSGSTLASSWWPVASWTRPPSGTPPSFWLLRKRTSATRAWAARDAPLPPTHS